MSWRCLSRCLLLGRVVVVVLVRNRMSRGALLPSNRRVKNGTGGADTAASDTDYEGAARICRGCTGMRCGIMIRRSHGAVAW